MSKRKPQDPDWCGPLQDGRYDLPPAERERWLWHEMDPWADLLVTDQWTEIIAAYRRSNGVCGICGQPVDLTISSGPLQPTIDHIVPQTRGGSSDRVNLQLAHRVCNNRKGNR